MTQTLWSKRYNPARGNHWVAERAVTSETAQSWLNIFTQDEPGVIFVVAAKKPTERMARKPGRLAP